MRRALITLTVFTFSACASPGGVSVVESQERSSTVGGADEPVRIDAAGADIATGPDHTGSDGAEVLGADGGDGGDGETRRPANECSVQSKTMDTAIEAFYAVNGTDIITADQLVDEGYLVELDPDFVVDFTGDSPTALPTTGGGCDYDFFAEIRSDNTDETDRLCWLDRIAVETAVRGHIAEVGSPPASFEQINDVYPDFPGRADAWPTVDLGSDGEVVDTVRGGCSVADNLDVFGPMWVDEPPQCAVDAWALAWALELNDRVDDEGVSVDLLVSAGLIEQRSYLYAIDAGRVADVADSGCPSVEPTEADLAEQAERACSVELKTLRTAADAFTVQQRRDPVSIDELVAENLLRDDSGNWILLTAEPGRAASFEPVAGGRCDLDR